MTIKTPHWAPEGTHPTTVGWMTPEGEVVKKQKFTAEEIAEWYGNATLVSKKQTLHEAPVVETQIDTDIEKFHYGENNEDKDLEHIG